MQRSADVLSASKSFASLLLPPHVQQALRDAGFRRPSPVQEAALPLARLGADLIVQAKAGTGKTLVFAAAAVERVDLANAAPQVRGAAGPAAAARMHRRPPGPRRRQPAQRGAGARSRAPSGGAGPLPGVGAVVSSPTGFSLLHPWQVVVLAPTREIALQASEAVALCAAALPPPGLACGSFIGGLPVEEDEKQLRRWGLGEEGAQRGWGLPMQRRLGGGGGACGRRAAGPRCHP